MHNPCPYDLVIGLDRSDAKAELRVPHVCLSHEDPIARSGTIQGPVRRRQLRTWRLTEAPQHVPEVLRPKTSVTAGKKRGAIKFAI